METEILREFKLRLKPEVVISNCWHLKFVLSRAMRERDNFGYLVKLTVSTFKEDAERILVLVTYIMKFSKIPFQHANKDTKEADTRKANDDKVESSRKI